MIEAWNVHEALEVLRHGYDVRLVFGDIRIPGTMDGVKFASLVRSDYPRVKIVLTSSHLPTLDWAANDGFFPKPYSGAGVIRHIKALLD